MQLNRSVMGSYRSQSTRTGGWMLASLALLLVSACAGKRDDFGGTPAPLPDAGEGRDTQTEQFEGGAGDDTTPPDASAQPSGSATATSAGTSSEAMTSATGAASGDTTAAPSVGPVDTGGQQGGAGGQGGSAGQSTGGQGGTGGMVDPPDGPACGNGAIESPEECDDADTQAGDGCSDVCVVEPGWECDAEGCTTICGDGLVVGSEAQPGGCDDNNSDADDGCAACVVESGWTCDDEPSDCVDINECASDNGGCGELAACANSPGGYTCGDCPSGFTEDQAGDCVDIDECASNNGGCDELVECDNTDGGRTCGNCPLGYVGTGDSGCEDIDECDENNGGCDALVQCDNTEGGRTCGECPDGYDGDGEAGCEDIDECEVDNGGCDPLSECDNTDGGRTCGECPDGYDGNGETGCEPCVSAATALRLWEVHLGQSDYVMIKNPTSCLIELEDLQVLFDDRDDAFDDPEIDCTMSLPDYQLLPGASVRLHEHARVGDISVTDNKISECTGDLPFNPQRGGVTYLCDGACANGSVIDAMAFTGYEAMYATPPAMRFGTTFASPPGGITNATQDSAHFVRTGTTSVAPTFKVADWTLANRSIYASFETAVNVSVQGAAETAWAQLAGQSATIATDASNAAVGTLALKIEHTGSDGPSTTLRVMLPAGVRNPRTVSYFVRAASASAAAGYFDLLTDTFHATQLSFESTGLGAERENNVRTEVPFSANTWYQVELRDISFANREFDLYINRELVATQVEFWSNANFITELRLFSVSAGSVVYFDEIELWQ